MIARQEIIEVDMARVKRPIRKRCKYKVMLEGEYNTKANYFRMIECPNLEFYFMNPRVEDFVYSVFDSGLRGSFSMGSVVQDIPPTISKHNPMIFCLYDTYPWLFCEDKEFLQDVLNGMRSTDKSQYWKQKPEINNAAITNIQSWATLHVKAKLMGEILDWVNEKNITMVYEPDPSDGWRTKYYFLAFIDPNDATFCKMKFF